MEIKPNIPKCAKFRLFIFIRKSYYLVARCSKKVDRVSQRMINVYDYHNFFLAMVGIFQQKLQILAGNLSFAVCLAHYCLCFLCNSVMFLHTLLLEKHRCTIHINRSMGNT